MGTAGSVHVDELDLRIIGALQVDGRRPVAEIARELGVPKSTVQRRLEALIRGRVIMVAAYADSEQLGLEIHAHLNLRVQLGALQRVTEAVGALTEVRWLAVTTGPYDIVAEAYFASASHLHEFIRDRLAAIDGIVSVETSVILSVEKITFHWDALLREAARHGRAHVRLSTPADAFRPAARDEDTHCRSPDEGCEAHPPVPRGRRRVSRDEGRGLDEERKGPPT